MSRTGRRHRSQLAVDELKLATAPVAGPGEEIGDGHGLWDLAAGRGHGRGSLQDRTLDRS